MNGLMSIYPMYGILIKPQMNDHCKYDDYDNIIIYDNQMIIMNESNIFIYLPFPWQFGVSTNVR